MTDLYSQSGKEFALYLAKSIVVMVLAATVVIVALVEAQQYLGTETYTGVLTGAVAGAIAVKAAKVIVDE